MICTRDLIRRGAFVAALSAIALSFAAPSAASVEQAAKLVAEAQKALSEGDGIAAQVRLEQAMDQGARREAVAAYMGEAYIAQGKLDRAHDWLAPGAFTRHTAARGFRTLARLEQMQGDLAAAGAAYDRVIALTPKDASLWVEIARLRYVGGEHMLALDAANYAFELDPAHVRVLELRGQIVRDQYGLVAALPWFEAALARSPDDPSVLGEYAATLGELGRAKEMLAVVRKLLQVDPGNARGFYLQAVLAARAGNFQLARRLMDRTGDDLKDVPSAQLLEGVLELEAGNYVLATEALETLVRRQPRNARARLLLLRTLFLSGEYRQLVIRFDEDAAAADASPYLLTVLARSHEALGERDLAATLLDRAAMARTETVQGLRPPSTETSAAPDSVVSSGNFDALAQAGDMQLAAGQATAALERYKLAARIRMPENLMLRMVAAHRLAGEGDQAEALAESYLSQHPRSESAGRLVASLAAQTGDWKRAGLLLQSVEATAERRDVRLFTDLSLAQLRSGDAKAAEASARKAWQVQRASPLAAQAWGLSLAAVHQRPNTAAALLAKARQLLGDTPLIAEGIGRLAKRQG